MSEKILSYGRSALGISIRISGFDELLEKVEAAGNSIEKAAIDAVNAGLPVIEKTMKEGAERHRRTGHVVEAIEITPAKQQGNLISGSVGIDLTKHPEAKEALYQEYGDGHSPQFPDPFIRPALDNNKAEIGRTIKATLKKRGIPVTDGNVGVKAGKAGG